jgi:hypothetical protein
MQAAKITLFSVCAFAGLFGLFSLMFYFGDWPRLAAVASLGVFLGVLAAPQFDRKAFKYPTVLQAISGGVAGYILGAVLDLSPESRFALVGLGTMLGATANSWVKHVPVP